MVKQERAVDAIMASLTRDPCVKAVFLKGSMGRNEHDENSDVDLYCLVEEEDKEAFLKDRKSHVESYGTLLFYDEIFIIAPQIIAVYDDMLHLDLFTVTEETIIEKDYFSVLYDPDNRMANYHQHLTLSHQEFINDVDDTAFFLFQYEKAKRRGNKIWSVQMLNNVMVHFARVLLHRYHPNRAQLGLKTLDSTLEGEQIDKVEMIFRHLTIDYYETAAELIRSWLNEEEKWILEQMEETTYTHGFLKKMIECN
ncbi:nucleotidyltransferase domain-containing protein [Alkalihalobacillus macyae]|uniref:nucleotidyltransferase domain-containing protein n=1 Tax=Guptibacillus hwajinpoensis TaxID=208199 RepID=UPI00273AEA65|nr:nucleotidyltransferase domain-containing protein [Alkalihalobacillus macyae]MDP4553239.1 nucleotidyltransferase domain-containing protein [Alkalihalobacillus macyae]